MAASAELDLAFDRLLRVGRVLKIVPQDPLIPPLPSFLTHWTRVGCVWLVMLQGICLAQTPFAPPPPPEVKPSEVRGVQNALRGHSSPAQTTPSPSRAVRTAPKHTPIRRPGHSDSQQATSRTTSQAKPISGGEIIARIDGQIVLASDLMWQVNQIVELNRDRIPPEQIESAKQMILRQQLMGVIDTKLLYADFRRKVPAENIPKVEENLEQPFEEMEIPRLSKLLEAKDRSHLATILEQHGSSLEDLKRQFIERTIAGEWLRQMAPEPKPVTHQEMLDYYQEHLEDYQYPSQARWEELMIRFARHNGDRAAAWREIAEMGNQIWQRVTEDPSLRGPVFEELAKARSHGFTAQKGGAHDWTTQGALRAEKIDEALFSLEVGQLSNIIETEQGFHIVRVLERKQAGRTPFTEAQAAIREKLEKNQQMVQVQAEIEKLRKKSRVWTIFHGEMNGPQVAQMLSSKTRL